MGGSRHVTQVTAISGDGRFVVGSGCAPGCDNEAFIWTDQGGFVQLACNMAPVAVSDDGAIVAGAGCDLWKSGYGVLRMQDVLSNWGVSIGGWTNLTIVDMSADGTVIIGYGTNPQGTYESWIATIPAAFFPPLQSGFNASPTTGVAPLAVTFTDTSTGVITNRYWIFGDGTTTNTTNTSLTHTYNANGSYNLQLVVTGPSGASTNSQASLIVVGNPPQLVINPTSLNYGTQIVGQTNNQIFQIINTGDQTLSGTVNLATAGTPFTLTTGSFNVSGHQTNTVTVTFNPLAAGNFTNQVVFLSNVGNSTNTVTGICVAPTGSLQVNLAPAGAVSAGAQWQVDGGAWQNSGTIVSGLPAGTHTVVFNTISGWTTPGSQTPTISANLTNTVTGTYLVQTQYFTWATNNGTISITGYTGPGGTVIIPDTINGLPVTSIGVNAFENNTSLTNVIIGSNVTDIGQGAFRLCSGLTSVTIPNSVTNIGGHAFEVCLRLTGVAIPKSVTSIGIPAFNYCTNLSAVTVDALNSFYSSLGGVIFNKDQTTLILFPCGKTGSYTIPNSVTKIETYAFDDCLNLTTVTIPSSVTTIGDDAFNECLSLTNVIIPNSVTSIGDYAFYYCPRVVNVTIPNSATNVGKYAFAQCSGLTSITIPNSVTIIKDGVFRECTGLSSVTIPNSVTSIGDAAFAYCSGLTNVTISSSVTSIGYFAFYNCTGLSAITVDALNLFYSSLEGVVFNKSQTSLIICPAGRTGNYTIPNSVTTIGSSAFYLCSSLASVTIPNSVTTIGSSAFYLCSSLASVTIPNSVTNIGSYAFYYCTSLTRVTMGNNVIGIGDSAFSSCWSLTGVYFQGNAPGLGGMNVFSATTNATVYYLPGRTNWGVTFGGRPAVLWNPQAQTSGGSFGVRTNRFGFNLTGSSNLIIVVEASTNLVNPVWQPVSTNPLNNIVGTNGTSYFSDPQWTNYPGRFYRLRSP
jgi:PKD repeat protein